MYICVYIYIYIYEERERERERERDVLRPDLRGRPGGAARRSAELRGAEALCKIMSTILRIT